MPHFVIVEDDHLQAAPLEQQLSSVFRPATVNMVSTEEDFRAALPRMRDNVPDVVVMDVMLRWSVPRRNLTPPPEDVARDQYFRAGLRCAWLLFADDLLRDVPVVLYTILETSDLTRDEQDLPSNASYVGKNSDLDVLVRHIRSRLRPT